MRTVFYSWQSDTPGNRSFIEYALNKAIKKAMAEMQVAEAERPDLQIDKDTKGEPGSPDIVEVIFEKIEKCAIFVADLTAVGKTDRERLLPNPNVLVEYGYALRSVTKKRIVAVMNVAFGEPTETNMPFNIKKLRWPIQFLLEEDADQIEREKVKGELVNDLSIAITTIVKAGLLDSVPEPKPSFVMTKSTTSESVFLAEGEPLAVRDVSGKPISFYLPQGPKLFLRVMPTAPTEPLTRYEASQIVESGKVLPMFYGTRGHYVGSNRLGAAVFNWQRAPEVDNLTQLFLSKELWGIDVDDVRCQEEWAAKQGFESFEPDVIEAVCRETLTGYLKVAKEILMLPLPLSFIAGVTDILGYKIAAFGRGWGFGPMGMDRIGPAVLEKDIVVKGEIVDYDADVADILRPFFERIFDGCGLKRPTDLIEKSSK